MSDVVTAPEMLTNVDGVLFFAGTDAAHGQELWKSNGTAGGTVLVKDITPGPKAAAGYGVMHLSRFYAGGGKLFFLTVAETDGPEDLWVSNGTAIGTFKLVGPPDVSLTWFEPGLTFFNGQLYFLSEGNSDILQMFRTDGTADGEELFIGK